MVNHSQFMGYNINALPLSRLVEQCTQHIDSSSGRNLVFSCANPHALAIAESRGNFRKALEYANILVVDGVGLSIVGRILGLNLRPRITGSDFFSALMNHQNKFGGERKTRIYFFGSSARVLELMKNNLENLYSNLEFCGFTSPPYGDWSEEEDSKFVADINAAKPDILWVGMTAPKQEVWSHKNRNRLDAAIIGNIGAVFDFYAGTYDRAPKWAREMGLEWLVRLCKEPKRMWKRNFISPVVFVVAAVREKFLKKLNG